MNKNHEPRARRGSTTGCSLGQATGASRRASGLSWATGCCPEATRSTGPEAATATGSASRGRRVGGNSAGGGNSGRRCAGREEGKGREKGVVALRGALGVRRWLGGKARGEAATRRLLAVGDGGWGLDERLGKGLIATDEAGDLAICTTQRRRQRVGEGDRMDETVARDERGQARQTADGGDRAGGKACWHWS
ncbi:hypothetical protein NL676_018167 [Syzygium grande]|nr:hypothetical protein NL676_018167 [Syzygium grande]